MLASSFFDPVLGIDIHWEMVPMPAPVPTPIPNPFTGIIFDPVGLAMGLALSNAIGLVQGAKFQGPVVYWTAVPATNTGMNAKHIPGHILIPPGVSWAPVPKTPKPTVHPGETPTPPKPVIPDNDAVVITGSKTVHVGGSNAARMGDMLMSCSEPVRLPSSVVLPVPKGAPILIGGPMSLDIMAAVLASLRTRFVSDSIHSFVSRLRPSRFRNLLQRAVCFFTGHPVDVATGRVMTDAIDGELAGPLPFKIERVYSSAFASRRGPVGNGWSLSLDQALWLERGKVVYLSDDGREIEFDTFSLPGHVMREGEEVWHPIERMTLRRGAGGHWEITRNDGTRYHFAPVPGSSTERTPLRKIVSKCGNHEIVFEYSRKGSLEWVRDSAGRLTGLETDDHGRFVALKLPHPTQSGWYTHRRYRHDGNGDLVEVVDSLGNSWRFEYDSHLLVRETDRNGLNFYFQYDAAGEDAWCTRTWGDGGIFDHTIAYDKAAHTTFVTDSLGYVTRYFMNGIGLVEKIIAPGGATTKFEYDPATLLRTAEIDPMGARTERAFDGRGNLLSVVGPDGARMQVEYDSRGQATRAIDPLGGEWTWAHDTTGRVSESRTPAGEVTRFGWERGLLAWVEAPGGRRTEFRYNDFKALTSARIANGAETHFTCDAAGRIVASRDALGAQTRTWLDTEGRVVHTESPVGTTRRIGYDAEGNPVEVVESGRRTRFAYGNFHRVIARDQDGALTRMEYDTEGRLIGIVNEAGERCRFELDPSGQLRSDTGFDGRTRVYERDLAGKITGVSLPSGRTSKMSHDGVGRLASVEHSDGTFVRYEYRADGALCRVINETGAVEFERDAMGRVVREARDGIEVRSVYGSDGGRSLVETSLGARQVLLRDSLGEVAGMQFGPPSRAREVDVAIERDAAGREIARTLSGRVRVSWARDAAGRPSMRQVDGRGVTGPESLSAWSYRWNGQGQLEALVDAAEGPRFFERDARGRLVGERRADRTSLRVLDDVGNIYRSHDKNDRRYGPGGAVAEADGSRFSYDADGNLVEKQDRDGGVWRYAWNGHGQLAHVDRPDGRRVGFSYDPCGRRIRKSLVRRGPDGASVVESETGFVWDGEVVIHELSSEDGLITWFWEPDSFRPVAREKGGQRWTVASDHLGVPAEMYDELGRITWQMQLDVYGVPSVSQGRLQDCPWRFPGQYADPETGLHYNRFRYYSPDSGAYVSSDPIRIEGGLNFYAYVADVLAQIDPFGLQAAPYRARVQLQRGQVHLANAVIHSQTPITAVQVERAMFEMANTLPEGGTAARPTERMFTYEGAEIRIQVHSNGLNRVVPRAHGSAAQMSIIMRTEVVPTGGVELGGNPRWGRVQLEGAGEGIRLDFENLEGHNLQECG